MSASVSQRALLLVHPDSAGESVWSIAVEARLSDAGQLTCHYALHGDVERVRMPGKSSGRRADDLWRHTCFEAFIASAQDPGYLEFNFSPALDWAAYRFSDYRSGMSAAPLSRAPGLQVRRTGGQLDLTANVHLAGLPLCDAPALRIGLAAVVEELSGALSYWALHHGPGEPDFHQPDSFAFELRPA